MTPPLEDAVKRYCNTPPFLIKRLFFIIMYYY